MFKKGQLVVKVLDGPGDARTATIQTVDKVSKGVVRLQDSSLQFDAKTGREIDPAFYFMSAYLVSFDDGEIDKWELK